jgi:ABC-2 type transport system ATP-binding protein
MSVELRDLTIRYGSVVAVDRVSATFPDGAVGLLGRNGAGKSSILRALLGLVRPAAGQMQILDLPVDASPQEVRRVVGYMPEREAHIPSLNGYETVRLAAELTGLPNRVAARRAHEVLYFAGLEEQRYRPVSGYSTGMKQKVKLAVALVHDPKVLFLDEPTNGLDPGGRREMLQLVADLAGKFGKSIILSSHILTDVERVCEHIVLMEQGEVLAAGAVKQLTRHQTRRVHLSAVGDQARLQQALAAFSGHPVTRDAAARFEVTVADDLPSREMFAVVRDAGGEVREFREHHRSLEEVFLGAVQDSVQGGAGPLGVASGTGARSAGGEARPGAADGGDAR